MLVSTRLLLLIIITDVSTREREERYITLVLQENGDLYEMLRVYSQQDCKGHSRNSHATPCSLLMYLALVVFSGGVHKVQF